MIGLAPHDQDAVDPNWSLEINRRSGPGSGPTRFQKRPSVLDAQNRGVGSPHSVYPRKGRGTDSPGVARSALLCDLVPQRSSFGTGCFAGTPAPGNDSATRPNATCLCHYGTDAASLTVLQLSRQFTTELFRRGLLLRCEVVKCTGWLQHERLPSR